MIDVMNVRCPHCNHDFDVDVYFGEEAVQCDASLKRTITQRVNWSEISNEIQSGNGNAVLSVGDKLSFRLKDGTGVSVSVVALNPYQTNSAAFAFDKLYWTGKMNQRNTTSGGWAQCHMADYLDRDIFSLLPDELQAVIKPREIVQKIDGKTYRRTSKLWLPSYTEVFGEKADWSGCDTGDVRFDFFKERMNRIGILARDDTVEWTWLRSVRSASYFANVFSSGYAFSSGASYANGVRPLFFV